MIQTIDLIFYFGGKTDSMQFITPAQAAHDFAYLTNLANRGTRVAVFNVDARAGLDTISRVVAIVGNIARAIFDEVIFGQKSRGLDHSECRSEKRLSFVCRHIEVDCLEQPAIHKAL